MTTITPYPLDKTKINRLAEVHCEDIARVIRAYAKVHGANEKEVYDYIVARIFIELETTKEGGE